MRHHTNCSDWGYESHPNRSEVTARCDRLTGVITRRVSIFDRFHFDTRPAHAFMFRGLTPDQCTCLLGRYRGDASCPELKDVRVGVGADPLVGLAPDLVAAAMIVFEGRCAALVKVHNKWFVERGANQAPRNALLKFVSVLADVLEQFLTIHPYMDGNGHCARLLVWVMMARAGYTPTNWSIDAKQPYGDALSAHRRGKRGALQAFLLNAIGAVPTASAPGAQSVATS